MEADDYRRKNEDCVSQSRREVNFRNCKHCGEITKFSILKYYTNIYWFVSELQGTVNFIKISTAINYIGINCITSVLLTKCCASNERLRINVACTCSMQRVNYLDSKRVI